MAEAPRDAPRFSPVALVRRLLGDERVRFILIGGVNTVVGYLFFVVVHLTLGDVIGDLLTLYVAYVPATLVAFVLHRHVTYRRTGTGNVVIDFFRFQSVYLVSLLINSVALVLLVELAHVPTLIAQALIVVVTTLVSYFGHKFFSFRRPAAVAPLPDEPVVVPGDRRTDASPDAP
jgi:putative flippase GtrA